MPQSDAAQQNDVDSVNVLIAFGSNVGDSLAAYHQIPDELARAGLNVLATSAPIQTLPVGSESNLKDVPIKTESSEDSLEVKEPNSDKPTSVYLNAALTAQTKLSPRQLMGQLLVVEKRMGRVRDRRWGPRTVDLDLLLYDDKIIDEEGLVCPHPRMTFRRFVLQPAAEIAADWIHPVSGKTIGQLFERLDSNLNAVLWVGAVSERFCQSLIESKTPLGHSVVVPMGDQKSFGSLGNVESSVGNPRSVEVCMVQTERDFLRLCGSAKLVVIGMSRETNPELWDLAVGFGGATLRLDLESCDAKREFMAAVDAMS